MQVPDFVSWFRLELTASDGSLAPRTPFGKQLLNPERSGALRDLHLAPGEAVEAQLPLESLFRLSPGAGYRAIVKCQLNDGAMLVSNAIAID